MVLPYGVERLVAQNLESAIARGVAGAALVELDGTPLATAGMQHDELRPFVRSAVSRLRPEVGGLVSFTLDDHVVAFGTADSLCVIAVLNAPSRVQFALVDELRDEIARILAKRGEVVARPPTPSDGSGGSSSEPSDLAPVKPGDRRESITRAEDDRVADVVLVES